MSLVGIDKMRPVYPQPNSFPQTFANLEEIIKHFGSYENYCIEMARVELAHMEEHYFWASLKWDTGPLPYERWLKLWQAEHDKRYLLRPAAFVDTDHSLLVRPSCK